MNDNALLFLDLDGTLVGDDGRVAESLWRTLETARSAGLRMSVCTGRPSGGVASAVAARLDPETLHIFHGGAVIRRVLPTADGAKDDVPFVAAEIHEGVVMALVYEARKTGRTLELYTHDATWVESMTDVAKAHEDLLGESTRVTDLADLARERSIVKAQWVTDRATADGLAAADQLPGIHAALGVTPSLPAIGFVTLTRADVHKGWAVARVCDVLGVAQADAWAVGDATGDIPMLDAVGRPYAMAEAPPSMTYPRLGSIDDDGVLELPLLSPFRGHDHG